MGAVPDNALRQRQEEALIDALYGGDAGMTEGSEQRPQETQASQACNHVFIRGGQQTGAPL